MDAKKYAAIATIAVALMVGGAGSALADNASMSVSATTSPAATMVMLPVPANAKATVVDIGANGNVLLRGTIDSVAANSLTVKSWGGDWTVNIPSSATLMPTTDMTQFSVGDFVGVTGTVDSSSSWTVSATLVRDWTVQGQVKTNKTEVNATMKASSPKNWQGTISNINTSSNSFTLTIGSAAYTVNLVSDVKVLNQKFITLALSKINSGDTVRVWGTLDGTTVTAYIVRDISITQ